MSRTDLCIFYDHSFTIEWWLSSLLFIRGEHGLAFSQVTTWGQTLLLFTCYVPPSAFPRPPPFSGSDSQLQSWCPAPPSDDIRALEIVQSWEPETLGTHWQHRKKDLKKSLFFIKTFYRSWKDHTVNHTLKNLCIFKINLPKNTILD